MANKKVKSSEENLYFLEKKYKEGKIERGFARAEKVSEEAREVEARLNKTEENFKEELKTIKENFQKEFIKVKFQTIEILSIFVAIIGFVFGSMNLVVKNSLGFSEIAGLISILGFILIVFIFIIHLVFSKP